LAAVSVTRVVYAAEGWGEGELWLDGTRLVWHELPHPRPHPHPGGGETRHPLRSTIPGNDGRGRDANAPIARLLVHRLQKYFGGEPVGFDDVELDLDDWTAFQLDLARTLRDVEYGSVVSYSELAQAAGYPNAQRAAGTFCARNRYPIVLPCHRVVAADGLGSYGSLGIDYKRRLLALEHVSL
jgi:methylated-DNA-[protein]-cysteine S-methyltransferase